MEKSNTHSGLWNSAPKFPCSRGSHAVAGRCVAKPIEAFKAVDVPVGWSHVARRRSTNLYVISQVTPPRSIHASNRTKGDLRLTHRLA